MYCILTLFFLFVIGISDMPIIFDLLRSVSRAMVVVLKLEPALESPGELTKIKLAGPLLQFLIQSDIGGA